MPDGAMAQLNQVIDRHPDADVIVADDRRHRAVGRLPIHKHYVDSLGLDRRSHPAAPLRGRQNQTIDPSLDER